MSSKYEGTIKSSQGDQWWKAISVELDSYEENKTKTVVKSTHQKNKKGFAIKRDESGDFTT